MDRPYVDRWGLHSEEPNLDPQASISQRNYAYHLVDRIHRLLDQSPDEAERGIAYLPKIIAEDINVYLLGIRLTLTSFQHCPPGTEFMLGPVLWENRRWVAGMEQARELLSGSNGVENYLRAYKDGCLIFLGKAYVRSTKSLLVSLPNILLSVSTGQLSRSIIVGENVVGSIASSYKSSHVLCLIIRACYCIFHTRYLSMPAVSSSPLVTSQFTVAAILYLLEVC